MDLPELGSFLRSRRARITPGEVGMPAVARRRVAGLRREEVATLAGASVEYYTELERGRGAQPSPQMLGALARALRLTTDERDYLYRLAGRLPPPPADAPLPQAAMVSLLSRLEATPARILTDLHETLIQNDLATDLLGEPAPGSFIESWFTQPAARGVHPAEDHPHHSRVLVHDLRAAVARRGPHTEASDLVARLREVSAEFRALWESGDVAVRRGDRKRICHPVRGVLAVTCENLFSEDGRQRLQFFTPGADVTE